MLGIIFEGAVFACLCVCMVECVDVCACVHWCCYVGVDEWLVNAVITCTINDETHPCDMV